MALPSPGQACVRFDLEIPDFRWRFPFGIYLEIEYNGLPVPADIIGSLLARVNTALLPFVPIFDLIDAILALKKIFDALKTLDLLGLVDALEPLLKIIDTLKGGIPQLSVPLFIKDSLSVIILFLQALRDDLAAIIESQSAIDLAGARAQLLASADLQAVVDCSQANLDFTMFALQQSNAKPLARLISLLNLIADLAGMPNIPAIEISGDADQALVDVDNAIAHLTVLRDSIPG
jgi:hypothetical protein